VTESRRGFWLGAAVIGVVAAGFVVTFWVYGLVQLGYSAGWAGTPGTISRVSCDQVDPGGDQGETQNCYADFTPDGGGPVVRTLDIGHQRPAGPGPYPARLHHDGTHASLVGPGPIAHDLGLLVIPLVPVEEFAWTGYRVRRHRRRHPPVPGAPQPTASAWRILVPPLVLAVLLLIAGITLAAQ
jgi:hypothetical protein